MAGEAGSQRRSSMEEHNIFQKNSDLSQIFIHLHDGSKEGVKIILQELRGTSDKIKELHSEMNQASLIGAVVEGLGIGLGVATVGVLLYGHSEKTEKLLFRLTAVLISNTVTFLGAAAFHKANLQMWEKYCSIMETWRNLSDKFKNIIEPQKDALKNLKKVLDEINKTATESTATDSAQEEETLSEINKLLELMQHMDEPTKYDRAELSFTHLVDQYEKIYDKLTMIRNDLMDFKQ